MRGTFVDHGDCEEGLWVDLEEMYSRWNHPDGPSSGPFYSLGSESGMAQRAWNSIVKTVRKGKSEHDVNARERRE